MSDSSERVTCPGCKKGYRWKSSLIGRHVPCKQCGSTFEVPIAPGVGKAIHIEPGDDGYALDEPETASASHAAPASSGKCPSCNSPVREGAVLCMNCGFSMAEGKKMAGPSVAALPAKERKALDKELSGMKWVRNGLWIHLLSLLMVVGTFTLPIIALIVGLDFVLVATITGFITLATGLTSSIMCLAAPKESNTRLVLFTSIAFTVASLVITLLVEFGIMTTQYDIATLGLDITAKILFLCFFIQLAKYLEFDQIVEQAKKVLGLYILLIIDAVLIGIGIFGCIFLIFMLGLVIYTIVLYVALVIDLNNALVYRIAEQSD